MQFGEIFIVLNDFNVENHYEEKVELKKDTLLSFVHAYNLNHENETYVFYLAGNQEDGSQISIPGIVFKNNIKNYMEYYQEQFDHLDKKNHYFGQLFLNTSFLIEENGKKIFYQKTDEYTTSDGTKFNAYRFPTFNSSYWAIDDMETYQNKEFTYFNPEQKIDTAPLLKSHNFIPPRTICVPELFVDFPQMLDVVEILYKKENLSNELEQIYKTYTERKSDAVEYFEDFQYIPINTVLTLVEQKNKDKENTNIMEQIEKETQIFRNNLIKQRIK